MKETHLIGRLERSARFSSILTPYLRRPSVEIKEQKKFEPRLLNIFDIHFKHGATDGVSIVAQNLCTALENKFGSDESGVKYHFGGAAIPHETKKKHRGTQTQQVLGLVLAELGYQGEKTKARREKLFPLASTDSADSIDVELNREEMKLLGEIYNTATLIYQKVKLYIVVNNIGTVLIRNIMSMALNPAATLGLYWVCTDDDLSRVQFQLMHHDLYNEPVRQHKYQTPYPRIKALIAELYPPALLDHSNVVHACLNTAVREKLKKDKDIEAGIVFDSVDYAEFDYLENRRWDTPLEEGEYNWRAFFNLSPQDLMVYVSTRVTDRKAIGFAIQIVCEMQKMRKKFEALSNQHDGIGRFGRAFTAESRIVLCIPQFEDAQDNQVLIDNLKKESQAFGVDIRFASDIITRTPAPPTTAFMQVYGQGDLPLYPSIQEGFGNQLEEILASGNPLIISEYPNLMGLLQYVTPDIMIARYDKNANQRLDVLDKKGNFGGFETTNGPLWYLQAKTVERVVQDLIELYALSPATLREQFWRRRAATRPFFDLPAVACQFTDALPFGLGFDRCDLGWHHQI